MAQMCYGVCPRPHRIWVLRMGLESGFGEDSRSGVPPHPALLSEKPNESWGLISQEPAEQTSSRAPDGAGPAHCPPSLPQERHVVPGINRVAEDVPFQGGHGLPEPEKEGVAGAQADLGRNGQR